MADVGPFVKNRMRRTIIASQEHNSTRIPVDGTYLRGVQFLQHLQRERSTRVPFD